jgi:hypothetical protein
MDYLRKLLFTSKIMRNGCYSLTKEDSLQINVGVNSFNIDKIDENATKNTPVTFRLNVKFDETSRKVGETTVDFGITINAEPNTANFGMSGKTVVKGSSKEIDQALSTSSDNQVPDLLIEIYRRIYNAIYVATSIIDVPCPSPELLKSSSSTDEPIKAPPEDESTDEKTAVSNEEPSIGELDED